MRTKTFKKVGITIRYTEENISYNEAVNTTPKGWRLIRASEAMKILEEYKNALRFWFWCLNPEWNEEDWRPVGRGDDIYRFFLCSYGLRGASRGVYVRK